MTYMHRVLSPSELLHSSSTCHTTNVSSYWRMYLFSFLEYHFLEIPFFEKIHKRTWRTFPRFALVWEHSTEGHHSRYLAQTLQLFLVIWLVRPFLQYISCTPLWHRFHRLLRFFLWSFLLRMSNYLPRPYPHILYKYHTCIHLCLWSMPSLSVDAMDANLSTFRVLTCRDLPLPLPGS